MRRRRLALGSVAAGALVVVAAVLLVVRTGGDSVAEGNDPHAILPNISAAEIDRIVNAAEAVSASTPDAELVAQGQKLFSSVSLARRGEPCANCHTQGGSNPEAGTIVHPQSSTDFTGPRDPPALWNNGRTAPYGWTGQVPTLEAQVTRTIKGHFVDGNATPERVAALSAYIRSLEPPVTSFDLGTMSAAALQGEELFQGKAGCIGCHVGPQFTDNQLHNIFVPQATADSNDPGAPLPQDPGAPPGTGFFNTPQLRDVRNTAPYMHNGLFKTLRDVVSFYNSASVIAPLGLTDQEIDDLVAYLRAL